VSATRILASTTLALLRLLAPVVIIVVALLGARSLLASREAPDRAPERAPLATAVETTTVVRERRRSLVVAYGTVQPRRRITLRPEVGGRIIDLHPDLIAGGRLAAGTRLLQIDPREYEYRVTEQEAALVRAEFDLTVEEGRGAVARREWELLAESVERTELGARLARREPHREEKLAAVKAARSRLAMARLDLERTELIVPFNALVLDESVEDGQLVSAQTSVATLIGTDSFHVRVSVPVDRLDLVTLPGPDGTGGSRVTVMHDTGDPAVAALEGRVMRLLGDVDPNGRMARLLVEVEDPLRLADGATDDGTGPLLVGEFVRVEIEGPPRDGLVVIPRRALREGGRVWVMNAEDALEIRTVTVAWGTDAEVMVSAGLDDGDRVVTTPLGAPVPGMPLTDVAAPAVAAASADAVPSAGEEG
jgi:RND family efflux transporter MFP subunit